MTSFATGLVPEIRAILEGSDLSRISAKGVRKELISRGHDAASIKENRDSIDAKIEAIYEELTAAQDAGSPSSLDEPLAGPASSLPEPLRRPAVKQEIKSEAALATAVPVKVETDAEMAARLQREFNAEGSGSRGRASRSGAVQPKKKKAVKRKSKATLGSDGEEGTPKKRKGGGGGAFNKELVLSDALVSLVGEPRLSRPQTVKRIWEYIKGNSLQDPSDGRFILCDGPMKAVFNTDKLHMFTMNKLLVHHMRDPDEIAGGAGGTATVAEAKPKVEDQGKFILESDSDGDD